MLTVNLSLMVDKSVFPILTTLLDNVFMSVLYRTVYVSVSFTILRTIHETTAENGVVTSGSITTGSRGSHISTWAQNTVHFISKHNYYPRTLIAYYVEISIGIQIAQ